jgi:negative regulator of genetic competence, sporulation and motility
MKFRKINEDKVQIILTVQDLEERDFKRWELIPMSPKLQEFFHDLLERAYKECGFEINDDSQLVVEAYPLNLDTFAIILTRIPAGSQGEVTGTIHLNGFDREDKDDSDDTIYVERGCRQVWLFSDLETCTQASAGLDPETIESSTLYKFQERYYLALMTLPDRHLDVAAILGEFGEWSFISQPYFQEYAQIIIADHAINNLAALVKFES